MQEVTISIDSLEDCLKLAFLKGVNSPKIDTDSEMREAAKRIIKLLIEKP